MKSSKIIIAIAGLSIVTAVLSCNNAFAGIWTDGQSGSGGSSSSSWSGHGGVTWNHTSVVAWFEYTYTPGYSGDAYIPEFVNGFNGPGVKIPSDCTQESTKFYSSGLVGYKEWGSGTKEQAISAHMDAHGNTQQLGVYHLTDEGYVGAISNSLSYAYSSAKTINDGWTAGAGTSDVVATGKIVSYSTANAAWKQALKNQGESESDLKSATASGGDYVTSFCAYDQPKKPEANQSATVTINVKGSGGSGSSSSTSAPLVLVTSPEIELWSSYEYTRDDQTDTAMGFFAKIKSHNGEYPSSDTLLSYSVGSSSVKTNRGTESSPAKATLPKPNVEYPFCSATKYPKTISTNENKTVSASDPEAKACIKVKWDPVVSKIQSKTKISAAGKSAESDWDSYAVLDLGTAKPNADEYNKSIAYGSNKFNVTWTHTLKVAGQQYYSKLKNGTGYGGIIDNSPVKFHARPADTGSLAGLDKQTQSVTPNSMRTINSWDSSIFKDSSLPSRYANGKISETGNIFPGQKLDSVSEYVFHDSEVYGDGKSYNGNFNDRESHASLTGVANYAECKLTGPEGKDVTYYMGVEGAANDYAGLYLDSSKGRTIVGDGSDKTTDVVWLKGDNNNATLNYEACFGAQIAEDANGGSGNDVFLLNTSNERLSNKVDINNRYGLDPYYSTAGPIRDDYYTGRTPGHNPEFKNILSSEIGGGTVKGRLDNNYTVKARTKEFEQLVLLGKSNLSYIAKTNGVSSTPSDTYAITMNVPYNYILDPQPATGSMGQDLTTVTVGTPINFKAKIAVSPRKNKDVQDSEYSTATKTTTIKANVFTVGPDESIADIMGEPGATYKVFNVHGKGQDATIADLVGHSTVPNVDDEVKNESIDTYGVDIDTPKDKVFADTIGQKYCMAVAVYPADSHNTETADIEKNADQSVALSGDTAGDGAYWRVSISCRTVAKYPSLSVEGNALHVAGGVNVSTPTPITVGAVSGVFGSWSEYGIIAGSSPAMASGATLAYATAHTGLNTTGKAGGNSGMARYNIETVGDYNMSGAAGQTEVAAIRHEIATLRSRLSRFRKGDTDGVAIYGSDLFDTSAVTYSGGNLSINSDIIKSDPNRQILIFARNITISNNVKRIDAWLIADNSIDTCSEKDVGGDNPITITDCTNELIINGPVVLGTGDQDESSKLKLDRTYGAESEVGDINGNIRRGEVFNYDPSSVQWAYKESLKDSKTEIQYIKERAVRY